MDSILNSELHLFIFEGKRAEAQYVNMLEKNFLGKRIGVKCVYDAEIYQLYEQLKSDDFALDIVNLLKERSKDNANILDEYNRDSFAYIYLFFDYDAHSTLADDDNLKDMLLYFNNETENGMLYISYPMVEAIRHYKDIDDFKHLTVKCKRANCPYKEGCENKEDCMKEPHYKSFVASNCRPQLNNINKYTTDVWKELINAHVLKMNYLVNDKFEFPTTMESQKTIFEKQQVKHIMHKCPEVAVLSALPLYILDYYGVEKLMQKLGENICDIP